MSAPLVLAVPAKGRLQENAENFFARSGLSLIKPRGVAIIPQYKEVVVADMSLNSVLVYYFPEIF